jgi:hypothetical protein
MSDAMYLINLANEVKHSAGIVVAESTGDQLQDDAINARLKIALDLRSRPRLAFRALMKRWGAQRIVRELY